jgi:IS30 family transposase
MLNPRRGFAKHLKLQELLKVKSYFTRPYNSKDKEPVENRIGFIRRFIPKHTDFATGTKARLKAIKKLINNRPALKFNYNTN